MLVIDDSTLSDNEATIDGGGIHNEGSAVLLDTTVRGSLAGTNGGGVNNRGMLTIEGGTLSTNVSLVGGGLFNFSMATLTDTIVTGNLANLSGGGIRNYDLATIDITRGILSDNEADDGGGIFNEGSAVLTDVTLRTNFALSGGGIVNQGTLTIDGGTLSTNVAFVGGGLLNQSVATVTGATVTGNRANQNGGGILSGLDSTTTIADSTLSGNEATNADGGGIGNNGVLTILNSTLSGNTAGDEGGGIFNFDFGSATISHATLWGNSADSGGGAIFVEGLTRVKSSVVGGSPSGGECAGLPIDSLGQNVGTDGSCAAFAQVTAAELALGPLQAVGGPTETHPLLSGSVAIDAAADCTDVGGGAVSADQRGQSRPAGSACDSGAFESQGPGTLTLAVDPAAALEGGTGDSYEVVFTVARESADGAVSVDVLLDPSSTATPGEDFTTVAALPVTVTLPLGETEAAVTVTVLGDLVIEPDETITLALANPTGGAVVGSPSTAGHTIVNDDVSVLEIPTLGPWGLGAMALLLAAAGLAIPRRRGPNPGRSAPWGCAGRRP
jgi:hypothetical protein